MYWPSDDFEGPTTRAAWRLFGGSAAGAGLCSGERGWHFRSKVLTAVVGQRPGNGASFAIEIALCDARDVFGRDRGHPGR